MYKLIAIDVDGTFLNSHHRVTARNRETLEKIMQKGIQVIFATGRQFGALAGWISDLGLRGPQITSGGAVIALPGTGGVIHHQGIRAEVARKVIQMGQKLGVTIAVAHDDRTFVYAHNKDTDFLVKRGNPAPIQVEALEEMPATYLMMIADGKDHQFRGAETALRQAFGEELGISSSVPYCLDLFDRQVSKGYALQVVLDRLRISPQETVAIGDGQNDISMLQVAGCGVAMGNACAAVKQAADHVTATCDEEGVSIALESLVLK